MWASNIVSLGDASDAIIVLGPREHKMNKIEINAVEENNPGSKVVVYSAPLYNPRERTSDYPNAGILNAGISRIIIIFDENERFCSIFFVF